jgi:hypothetical protein
MFLTPVKNNKTFELKQFIYTLFEKIENSPSTKKEIITYICLKDECKKKSVKIKCFGSSNSNLYNHLKRDDHRDLILIINTYINNLIIL